MSLNKRKHGNTCIKCWKTKNTINWIWRTQSMVSVKWSKPIHWLYNSRSSGHRWCIPRTWYVQHEAVISLMSFPSLFIWLKLPCSTFMPIFIQIYVYVRIPTYHCVTALPIRTYLYLWNNIIPMYAWFSLNADWLAFWFVLGLWRSFVN